MVETSPWKDVLHAGTPPKMPYAIFGMAIAFMSIAFWLIFEINISVLRYFKKKRGLYFWSLLISSWGTFFHTLGYVTQWWAPNTPWILNTCFILFGWSAMITGQSLVLYSRLHLVILDHKLLRGVLWLIIITAITIQIPQWVATWGATDTKYSVTKYWSPIDSIMVRISQAVFLCQEGFLSLLYIWGAVKMLVPNLEINVRKVMLELIAVSTILIVMDIVILVLAYTNEHIPKEPVQNFAYALKLKMEFIILNQLLDVLHRNRNGSRSDRYLNDSRKKSGGEIGLGSHGSASNGGSHGQTEKVGSPMMSPRKTSKPWNPLPDDSSGDSSNAAVFDGDDYHHGMRSDSQANLKQTLGRDKVAWVTRKVDVRRSP